MCFTDGEVWVMSRWVEVGMASRTAVIQKEMVGGGVLKVPKVSN